MAEKTCGVTGHRDIPDDQIESVKHSLRLEIDKAIADGYTTFLSGFAEGADQLLQKSSLKCVRTILFSIWKRLFHTTTAIES